MHHPFPVRAHVNPATPAEIPITPDRAPEIEPGSPNQPEITPPLEEPGQPGIPQGPEIMPDDAPLEIPDYDEGAS